MNELTPKNEKITNCYAELYFRRKKMNKRELKIPLDQYVRNVWRTRKGLQRQFVDADTKWNSRNKAVSMKSWKPITKVLSEAEKEVEPQFSDKEVDSNNENSENDFEETWEEKIITAQNEIKATYLKKISFNPVKEKTKKEKKPSGKTKAKVTKLKSRSKKCVDVFRSNNAKYKKNDFSNLFASGDSDSDAIAEVKFSFCKLPAEWQNITIMHWGGKIVAETGKEISLKNTCTVDNFLWIIYCWYLCYPDTLDFIRNSDLINVSNLYEVVNLMFSEKFDDAKVRWLSLTETSAYVGSSNDGNTLDFYGTHAGVAYAYIKDFSERKFEAKCTSSFCPGTKTDILRGCDIDYIPGSVNMIEESIAMWESGYHKKMPC